jgi:flagellar basal body-associated protein FliL
MPATETLPGKPRPTRRGGTATWMIVLVVLLAIAMVLGWRFHEARKKAPVENEPTTQPMAE